MKVLLSILFVSVLLCGSGCATIFSGPKKESQRTAEIMWGYFVLDLFGGMIPLLIDFGTGAIYKAKDKDISFLKARYEQTRYALLENK